MPIIIISQNLPYYYYYYYAAVDNYFWSNASVQSSDAGVEIQTAFASRSVFIKPFAVLHCLYGPTPTHPRNLIHGMAD
eukprot:scaffold287828_cov18-Prasinocladus_malaysianus.AAC.1